MNSMDWLYQTMGSSDETPSINGSQYIAGATKKTEPAPKQVDVDLAQSKKDLVKNEFYKNVICDKKIENLLTVMNEKGIGFVTMKLLGIEWIKYYESEHHVFWTPVDNSFFPCTTIGLDRYQTIIHWMTSRLEWEIAHVKIAIPSKFQHDKICSFFKRNHISFNKFWHKPRWFDWIRKWFGRTIAGEEKELKEFRPIIIEDKLGGVENDSK